MKICHKKQNCFSNVNNHLSFVIVDKNLEIIFAKFVKFWKKLKLPYLSNIKDIQKVREALMHCWVIKLKLYKSRKKVKRIIQSADTKKIKDYEPGWRVCKVWQRFPIQRYFWRDNLYFFGWCSELLFRPKKNL